MTRFEHLAKDVLLEFARYRTLSDFHLLDKYRNYRYIYNLDLTPQLIHDIYAHSPMLRNHLIYKMFTHWYPRPHNVHIIQLVVNKWAKSEQYDFKTFLSTLNQYPESCFYRVVAKPDKGSRAELIRKWLWTFTQTQKNRVKYTTNTAIPQLSLF